MRRSNIDLLNMVLFGRKAQSDRRELLASMDQMAVGKPVDNGELTNHLFNLSLRTSRLSGILFKTDYIKDESGISTDEL